METKHTPEAIALADAVLKASGSGLRHYSLPKTRDAIMSAAQQGIDAAQAGLLIAIEDAAEWLETGEVDGVFYDKETVLESLRAAIAKAKGR